MQNQTIEKIVAKYHWLKIGDDGVLEMYLDHHSLQSFRQCEGYFEASIMASLRSKGRNWSLTFGILYHEMMDYFYTETKNNTFNLDSWLTQAYMSWNEMRMDEFKEHKSCKALGGLQGFLILLTQYVTHFAAEQDRLRAVAIEVGFGKKKEVPLGEFEPVIVGRNELEYSQVRCYLTGRIDFLMDSGNAIGPLDHKTSINFMGKNPANSYDPQEGMTGYIYATNKILEKNFPELLQTRKCDRVWMSFAQVTPTKEVHERFKRIPIFKTQWQLEQYRLRQISTFQKVYDMVISGRTPDWNTAICNNMFHSECPYRNLHKQNTNDGMLNVLRADFIVAPEWDTENPDRNI